MKNKYKYRGWEYLSALIGTAVVLASFFIIRYKSGDADLSRKILCAVGAFFGGGISLVFHFIRERRMTEEQYEAEQKKLRMESDERAVAIREKAALKALGFSSLIGVFAGFGFFVFDVFSIAITCFAFAGGIWIVDGILIAILNKKM